MSVQGRGNEGFTLLELVVVMGLLAAFCVMLVQLMTSGLRMFEEGEEGQALADRGANAARVVRKQLTDMLGPISRERGLPQSRLLVQWMPLGLDPAPEEDLAPTRVQILRALVRIDEDEERALVERQLEAESDQELADELAGISHGGRARLWLLPWPSGDADGAYLQLRRGLFLPGAVLDIDGVGLDPMRVMELSQELDAELVMKLTEPVVEGLLHVEFAMWSQNTVGWDDAGNSGPERAWDSARAGWLPEYQDGATGFTLDLGNHSLIDPTDDVYPRWVRVTLVVDGGDRRPAEGLLAEPVEAADTRLRLVNPDRFPRRESGGFVKVGGEWIGYSSLQGNVLTGLRRGLRGTAASPHPRGARARVGRTVVFSVRLLHGRENWNG